MIEDFLNNKYIGIKKIVFSLLINIYLGRILNKDRKKVLDAFSRWSDLNSHQTAFNEHKKNANKSKFNHNTKKSINQTAFNHMIMKNK